MFLVVSENGNGDITVWKHSKTLRSASNFCKKVAIENETVSILVIKKDYMETTSLATAYDVLRK